MADSSVWQDLSRSLRDLHRVLMERARREHERDRGVPLDPGRLLRLLTSDPEFDWLRHLSELMADIDAMSDAEPQDREAIAAAVRAVVEHMISPPAAPDGEDPFTSRYWPQVQADPEVAMAHAQVRRALGAWPAATKGAAAAARDSRRRLAEQAREQARGRHGRR